MKEAKDDEAEEKVFAGKKVKVVCLLCAGSSSTYFHQFRERLSSFAEVVIIYYVGHGRKINEPLDSNLEDMLRDTSYQKNELVNGSEFILFCYSMDGLLSYVLTAEPQYGIYPGHVFICSFQSSDILKAKRFHVNDECDVKQFLERYGNIVQRIYQDPRSTKAFLISLKKDFYNLT